VIILQKRFYIAGELGVNQRTWPKFSHSGKSIGRRFRMANELPQLRRRAVSIRYSLSACSVGQT